MMKFFCAFLCLLVISIDKTESGSDSIFSLSSSIRSDSSSSSCFWSSQACIPIEISYSDIYYEENKLLALGSNSLQVSYGIAVSINNQINKTVGWSSDTAWLIEILTRTVDLLDRVNIVCSEDNQPKRPQIPDCVNCNNIDEVIKSFEKYQADVKRYLGELKELLAEIATIQAAIARAKEIYRNNPQFLSILTRLEGSLAAAKEHIEKLKNIFDKILVLVVKILELLWNIKKSCRDCLWA